MDTQASDAATGVLSNLVAADLVTHEMIGDPSRLEGEAACLRALCSVVGGSVYRLDPFHYAFRAGPLDLGGRLGDAGPGDWAAELEAALQEVLGPDALWISATPPAPRLVRDDDDSAGTRAPVAYLRAFADAAGGLEPPEPGLRAVIDARYAAEIARLTAGAAPGEALDGRLSGLESRLDAMAQSMMSILARLEASETRLERLLERDGGGETAFQDNVGLALAEFLARLEQRAETGRAATPARETASEPLSAALGV